MSDGTAVRSNTAVVLLQTIYMYCTHKKTTDIVLEATTIVPKLVVSMNK
jgi:hypothetical protein